MQNKTNLSYIYITAILLLFTSCKKLLEVKPPINSVTTTELFSNNKQAEWAIAGIYSTMINGTEYGNITSVASNSFSAGLTTIAGGFSSDEMVPSNVDNVLMQGTSQNKLTLLNTGYSPLLWKSAFRIVYDATAAIEGLEASTSPSLADSVKKQLIGEALTLRAFSYFYLVNFFGDVPLVLTSDYKQTIGLARAPVARIYEQMKADLVKAKPLLSTDYSVGKNERVRVNRWAAEALLARVYLYTGEYDKAISSASAVIGQSGLFTIEQDLTAVFRNTSREAILQLKPTTETPVFSGTTPEALVLYRPLVPGQTTDLPNYRVSQQLMDTFEANDKRKTNWTVSIPGIAVGAKYKPGAGVSTYTLFRLAEMYLIRAEAKLLLNTANKNESIDDLNVLRRRAGVNELDHQLTAQQVTEAIAHERRVELFFEWGHRFFDLKRTGRAADVLSAVSHKQPWWGDYQLLYPIPIDEIKLNNNLIQNPLYK